MLNFDILKPSFQDINGNPCDRDCPDVKYVVMGNVRTCKTDKPQILINGSWVYINP